MTFDFFILPFFVGLLFLITVLAVKYTGWIKGFPAEDKALMRKGIFTGKSLSAVKEVFMESLLHRSMFKRNFLLGYMHMSLAFGWFLLIVCGNLESRIYSMIHINPPYYPIFLKYFVHDKRILTFELNSVPGGFRFLMDLFLAMVLSGVILALVKRSYSKWFGLKKATQHTLMDRMAITTLWMIFPLRLLAESFTAGQYLGGGFITNNLGIFLSRFLPIEHLSYPTWWAYSLALGIFFVSLPYSRFMHIPTEVLLIFMRHYGVKSRTEFNNFSLIEVNSCPRCGVCLDACPLYTQTGQNRVPPAYFIRSIREKKVDERVAFDCFLCGRCQEFCPVKINTNDLRISQRKQFMISANGHFDYLPAPRVHKAEIAYFAGCMTHLTPTIKRSMLEIFRVSGTDYEFLDSGGSICCGRPLMLAGKEVQARQLMESNLQRIRLSGCKTLVTSCPICFKVFKEDYGLDIEVLHHSQFILRLYKSGKLMLKGTQNRYAYHDPCELGRGSGIYKEPRALIKTVAELVEGADSGADALCCGGSLGNTQISDGKRIKVMDETILSLMDGNPGGIITACPLCKKTLQRRSPVEVIDLSEMIARSTTNQSAAGGQRSAVYSRHLTNGS